MAQSQAQSVKPRLVLTQIELENFKSYYGRRVIGPFHKRFSSIVGPNGSGKSNVIDALLFVFGRRAKQIRLKKISELVHTSEQHPNCQQARVNVYFQEIIDIDEDGDEAAGIDDKYKVVENSKIIISRVATKESKSTYLINNKTATFTKVKELLLTKGIDLNNNRFLILQGEVESIAMMKPKRMDNGDGTTSSSASDGLLEYLEDIIGSNKYIKEINERSELVETLNNEVQERLNRVKIVERDRDKLSDAKNEAQQYIKMQLQSYKLQGVNKQFLLNKYQNRFDSVNTNLVEINNQKQQKEEKEKELKQEMKEIEDKYKQIQKERNSIEKKVKKSQATFQEFEQQDVTYNERSKYLKKEMNKIKRNKNNLEKQQTNFNETIEKNTESIPRLDAEIKELQESLEEEQEKQETMMVQLQEKTKPIKEEMEEKQKSLIPLKDRENSIKQEMDVINNNITEIENKTINANKRKETVLEKIDNIDTKINEQKENLSNLNKEIQAKQQNLDNMNNRLNRNLKPKEQQIQQEINDLNQRYQELKYLYDQDRMSNSGSRHQQLVNKLLQAQEKGDLTGIYGRLGDLGQIDEQYDVAASTAATSALNFVVVEKTHHAQRAVEYLKKYHLGRATMLILEKQKHLKKPATRKIKTPENVHRLYDLIRFKNEKFNIAFYFAFRDTLVANNLNQANNLAFSGGKRWRVVTIDGKLIETSGTMSGGGNKAFKGLMSGQQMNNNYNSTSVTMEQLDQVSNTLNQKSNELNQLQQEINSIKHQIKNENKVLNKLNINLRKLNAEINGLKQRKKTLNEQIPEIEKSTVLSQSEQDNLSELRQQIEVKNAEFLRAQNDCELLEDEIRDLEEQILNAGGNELRQQKDLVDRMKKKLTEKSKLSVKLDVEIKNCQKKLNTSTKKFKTYETNLTEMRAEYDEIKVKKAELEEKASELLNDLDDQKELLQEKDTEYKKLTKIVDKNKAVTNKLAKEIFDLTEQAKKHQEETKQLQHRIRKAKTEWTQLQRKHKNNKNEFLYDDDDEDDDDDNDNDNDNDAEEAEEQEEKKENNDNDNDNNSNAMDVDNEEDEDTDVANNNNEEEKEETEMEMEDKTGDDNHNKKTEKEVMIDTNRYLQENTLKFIMLKEEQLEEINQADVDKEIEDIRQKLSSSKVNMNAIEAYNKKEEDYVAKVKDLQSCKTKRDKIRSEYENFKTLRYNLFMTGFGEITKKLKEMYRMLTCGGDAELELVDSIDPFSEGVQFSVRPPKKSWKNISNLSGGEKTLSSMALVFALHHFKPTPLYVMDEIDAALDFKNVSIVANYIKEQTKNAQFVIISLRNNMFELANRLVGIYKTNNASKSITIDPKLFKLPSSS